MCIYNFKKIEPKWQDLWGKEETFRVLKDTTKPKYYVLDMFPYPSGAGLHVGHPLGYIASDIITRYKRHKGFNVMHPTGYDSFGLPAEQYAIQTGQHPQKTTEENIARYKKQLKRIGFSFTPNTEIKTSDPSFYKWTQWIFSELFDSWYNNKTDRAEKIKTLISLFESSGTLNVDAACNEDEVSVFTKEDWKGFSDKRKQEILLQYRLCYLADAFVNWCPKLGTVLANDEVINGVSERGGYPVIQKKMKQWMMRITAFAHRLIDDLNTVDWPQNIKDSQNYWIGKSFGAKVHFNILGTTESLTVFTTRPDTIFGVSFITLAPELDVVHLITSKAQRTEVDEYIKASSQKNEIERINQTKTVTGVFTGSFAIHPLTNEKIPIWIADYVLASYGTGVVMGVPAGDQRDFDFADQFDIPIIPIFKGVDISRKAYVDKNNVLFQNSDFLNGLDHKQAMKSVLKMLEKKKVGEATINYRIRDAVYSRQRYWGEPFPIYYKDDLPQIIDSKHYPIVLPKVEKYEPTQAGDPPLGNAKVWAWDSINKCLVDKDKIDGISIFPLELSTMPGWAGSSWYFYRYLDRSNDQRFVSKEQLEYWQEVDLYIGGREHATGHLIYARFWQKFLFDRGYVPVNEFAKKLVNQGMILGQSALIKKMSDADVFISSSIDNNQDTLAIHVDLNWVDSSGVLDIDAFKKNRPNYANAKFICDEQNRFHVFFETEKMSKSKLNVINPDHICDQYGADTLRLYEMFLGPLEQSKPWNISGISGISNFLNKLWRLFYNNEQWLVNDDIPSSENLKTLHTVIKKVSTDIENMSFNTSVSAMMIAVNEFTKQQCHYRNILEPFVILISPFTPHIAEELWMKLGHNETITYQDYPQHDDKFLIEDSKEYPISFNGKTKFKIRLPLNLSKKDIEKIVLGHEKTRQILKDHPPKKIFVIPQKIINIVV